MSGHKAKDAHGTVLEALLRMRIFCNNGDFLNETQAANYIHILEPQWNPSVESQAIGRVVRLGQPKVQ